MCKSYSKVKRKVYSCMGRCHDEAGDARLHCAKLFVLAGPTNLSFAGTLGRPAPR